MIDYVVRVVLPDRPGALGLVASRIGAVGGDITAIHILDREAGRAVDEFVITLGGDHLLTLLCSEIHEVDGVQVDSVRELGAGTPSSGASGAGAASH